MIFFGPKREVQQSGTVMQTKSDLNCATLTITFSLPSNLKSFMAVVSHGGYTILAFFTDLFLGDRGFRMLLKAK